jgi:hypothetical protein
MGGRFLWSSASDYLGRKPTYAIYLGLGAPALCLHPDHRAPGQRGPVRGHLRGDHVDVRGAFATVPAYLRDIFGTAEVSAIHGRLLTAWSAAGLAGPVLVNYIRNYQISHGVAPAQAYSFIMYLMSGLLVVGFVSNALVREVEQRFHISAAA